MSDVKHYIRARTFLDDPETEIDPVDRAHIEALLAISTAQRETACEVRYHQNRVAGLLEEIAEPLVDWLKAQNDGPIDAATLAKIVAKGQREASKR